TIECHGVNHTMHKTGLFNDKKLDVMADLSGRSLHAGKNLCFPTVRDSVIASEMPSRLLEDAIRHEPPVRRPPSGLAAIHAHRRTLREGYGLPVRPQECPSSPDPIGQPPIACGEDLCGMQEQQKKYPSDWEDPKSNIRGVC